MQDTDNAFAVSQEQHRKLTTQLTRLEVEIEAAGNQVKKLGEDAVKLFGTSDLDALKSLLEARIAENNRKKLEFIEAVGKLERDVAALRASAEAPQPATKTG